MAYARRTGDLSRLPRVLPILDAYKCGLIVEALRAAGGNQAEAARQLGLPRVTLHDKLRRHGLGEG